MPPLVSYRPLLCQGPNSHFWMCCEIVTWSISSLSLILRHSAVRSHAFYSPGTEVQWPVHGLS